MVHVPASQPGGACLPRERSPKFFNMSEKGHSFSKSLRGMALLKSPRATHQGGRFQAWKASSELNSRLLKLYTSCGVGASLARGNVGCLRQIHVGAPVIKGNPSERKSVLGCYCSLFPVSQCCS